MEDYSEKTTTSNLDIQKRFDKLEEEIKSLRSATTGFLAVVVLVILFGLGYVVTMLDDIKQDVR